MRPKSSLLTVVLLFAWLLTSLAGSLPAQAMAKDVQQQVLRSSVKLLTPFDADEDMTSLCSGTVLNPEGYILTNFHCIGYPTDGEESSELEDLGLAPGDLFNEQGLSIVAITDNPRQLPVPTYVAKALTADSTRDLAVLKIVAYLNGKQQLPKSLPLISAPLADSDEVEALDEVYVIGYPGIGGDTVTATQGKISGFLDEDQDNTVDWFKTDVLVNQGNSGGSAVSDQGELVGVPTQRRRDQAGNVIFLIRPVNHAVPLIQQAMKLGASATATGKPVQGGDAPVPAGQSLGQPVFGTGFTDKGITGQTETFESAINEVHAGLPYKGMKDGANWGYSWQFEGQDVTGQSDLKWKYGASGLLHLYLTSKKGLSDGSYSLQILLNNRVVQQGEFAIGEPQAPTKPQKPTADDTPDGVIITGLVVDANTRRPIANAIVVFLYPGLTVDDFDADESEGKADTVLAFGLTNAKGLYTTDVPLPRGEIYSAIVGAKGYQRIAEDDTLEIADDEEDLLELDPIGLERQ